MTTVPRHELPLETFLTRGTVLCGAARTDFVPARERQRRATASPTVRSPARSTMRESRGVA